MAKVTTNTQIDTINILSEANTFDADDLILLQRGSVSFKLKKQNLTLPFGQINQLSNLKVIGNVSGGGSAEEITIDTDLSGSFANHNSVASSKAIKDALTDSQTDHEVQYIDIFDTGGQTTTNGTTLTNSQLNVAKATLGAAAKEGNEVLIRCKQHFSFGTGNGTGFSTRAAYIIYEVDTVDSGNSYADSTWVLSGSLWI